jgi:cytochrome b6-f complex iron-sulfur subunit
VRVSDGFVALYAKCTHLGCTPRWLEAENKFKCPCHGSGYYVSGINFEGPAPRPLERAEIGISAEDGQIIVDKAVRYLYERGQWSDPKAFVKMA